MEQPVVHIRELCEVDSKQWSVRLQYGTHEWECTVVDPALQFGDDFQNDMDWVLERFPRHVPYETSKARIVFEQVLHYAENLERQLCLNENLALSDNSIPRATSLATQPSEEVAAIAESVGLLQLNDTPVSTKANEATEATEPTTPVPADAQAARDKQVSAQPAEIEPPLILLDIQACKPESLLHGLLWESLESIERSKVAGTPMSSFRYCVRHVHIPSAQVQEPPVDRGVNENARVVKCTFNILFVVSRPQKDEDIDPHLAAGAVVDILTQLPPELSAMIRVEVSRPGTWDAFQRHITEKTAEWRQVGGRGPWYDAVHFDVHGVIADGLPYLKFLSKSGTKEFRQNASRIGELLRDNEIGLVLMNSCESARVTGQKDSNLARVLLDYGVGTVVAMQFPLTTTGALTFIKNFYTYYLHGTTDVAASVTMARLIMLADPSRAANLGAVVIIPDFVIPVVYHNPTSSVANKLVFSELPPPDEAAVMRATQLVAMRKEHESLGHFIGRSYDVLELEWRLLRQKGSNVVLIHGMRGSGKTMLALWLTTWWSITRLSAVCYRFSYRPGWSETGFEEWLRYVYDDSRPLAVEHREELFEGLRNTRAIFIVDGLECAFHPLGQSGSSITVDDKAYLKDFIRRLQGGKTILILTSATPEPWLELPSKCIYHLSGLSLFDSHRVARTELAQLGHESLLQDEEKRKYIEYILYRLHFNPGAIIAVMRGMIAVSGPDPAAGFEGLLLAWIRPDYSLSVVRDSVEFVHRVHAKSKASDHARLLLLLGFAAPTNTYSSAFYEFLAKGVNSFLETESLTADVVAQFVEENFIGTGWIERLSTEGVPHEASHEYFLIHPMLTNAIRMILDAGQYRSDIIPTTMSMDMFRQFQGFIFQSFYRSIMLTATTELENRNSLEMRVNSLNYFSAMTSVSKNIMLYTSNPQLLTLASVTAMPISLHFWRQLMKTNAIHLPLDILLSHAQVALKLGELLAESDPDVHAAMVGIYCELCRCLYRFNIVKKSPAALTYVQKALRAASQMLHTDFISSQELAINMFLSVSSLGGFYIRRDYLGSQARAKAALLTSLLVCRKFEEARESSPRYRAHFILVCERLYDSSVAKKESKAVRDRFLALRDRIKHASTEESGPSRNISKPEPVEDRLGFRALAWNPKHDEHVVTGVSIAVEKASLLIEASSFESSKNILTKVLRQAILVGDQAAEFDCQRSLAVLYYRLNEWNTAEKHAMRAMVLAPTEEAAQARWLAPTIYQARVTYLQFALIFIRLGKWDMATCAFQAVFERQTVRMQGGGPPDFALAFQTAEDCISQMPGIIRFGLLLLSSVPSCLLSGQEATELGPVATEWLADTIRSTWPDFDLEAVDPERLSINPAIYPGHTIEDHPSSFELDLLLKTCQTSAETDSEEREKAKAAVQQVVDVLIRVDVDGRRQTLDNNASTENQLAESIEGASSAVDRDFQLSLPVEKALLLAQKSFEESAAGLQLDLQPSVGWERVCQVVSDWVEENSPLSRSATQSQRILRLLERMHEDGSSVPDPSNHTIAEVLDLMLEDTGTRGDEDELDQILDMLVPAVESA